MRLRARVFRRGCALAATVLLTQLVCACTAPPIAPTSTKAILLADLRVGSDYRGPVSRIAFDASGDAWMATTDALYRVQDGKAEAADVAVGGRRLALAPGGGVYTWLVYGDAPAGLFTVELWSIPKQPMATLRLPEYPFGFGTLHLGGNGQLIVTATPLQDAEGLGGEFLYVFWSRDGHILSRAKLEGPRIAVMDVAGDALLLLGESDAVAFRSDGHELWRLNGRFRKGALAAKGTVALLNPAERSAINEVRVFENGQATTLTMSAPVYDLALTADGSEGAVGIGSSEIVLLSPPTCNSTTCKPPRTLAGLSAGPASSYQITALRFVDDNTIAVGRIKEVGHAPPYSYPEGALAALTTSGKVLIEMTVPLEQPATWSPTIDVSYGVPYFAAYTPHRVMLVKLDH